MEKKQESASSPSTLLEARKATVMKMAQHLNGRVSGQAMTDVISRFLVFHDENMKSLSLDNMNDIAKFYLKKKGSASEDK